MICAQADRSRGRFNPGYGFQFSVGFAPSDWLNQSDAQLRKRLCTWFDYVNSERPADQQMS